MTGVCDLWRLNREKAVAKNAKFYGRAPRAFQYLEDVLALKDIDAVIISTPEHMLKNQWAMFWQRRSLRATRSYKMSGSYKSARNIAVNRIPGPPRN
jgi:hypothetical protein